MGRSLFGGGEVGEIFFFLGGGRPVRGGGEIFFFWGGEEGGRFFCGLERGTLVSLLSDHG